MPLLKKKNIYIYVNVNSVSLNKFFKLHIAHMKREGVRVKGLTIKKKLRNVTSLSFIEKKSFFQINIKGL